MSTIMFLLEQNGKLEANILAMGATLYLDSDFTFSFLQWNLLKMLMGNASFLLLQLNG